MVLSWLRERRAAKEQAREREMLKALEALDQAWDQVAHRIADLHREVFPREPYDGRPVDLDTQLADLREAADDEATCSRVFDNLVGLVCLKAAGAAEDRRYARGSLSAARRGVERALALCDEAGRVTDSLREYCGNAAQPAARGFQDGP